MPATEQLRSRRAPHLPVRQPSSSGTETSVLPHGPHRSWSTLYAARRRASEQFGKNVYRLPIVRRVRDLVIPEILDGERVLEIGAGDRRLEVLLAKHRRWVHYYSLDSDPCLPHDYRDLSEVTEGFDCVVALEVVEHLTIAELYSLLCSVSELLAPGGRLVVSTPNTFYPPAYLRDATHRTPLCYDELAGLVSSAGLNVARIVRVYHDPLHRKLLRRYAFGWLFRLLGLDFAKQIALVARKDEADQRRV